MRTTKVTTIKARPGLSASVTKQIEAARDLVFDAQAITTIAAAAVSSDLVFDEACMSRTLRLVSEMLGNVANLIEPALLVQTAANTEVSDG